MERGWDGMLEAFLCKTKKRKEKKEKKRKKEKKQEKEKMVSVCCALPSEVYMGIQ